MITLSIDKGFDSPFSARELHDLTISIKAIIYSRVSTHDQAEHGYSLESQVEKCYEKLVREHGVKDDEIIALIEVGEKGDNPNRPAFQFARWLIQQGVGQKFVIMHPDRLARNFRQQVEFIEDELLKNGIELISVEVPYDPKSAESILFFQLQGAIAQYNKAKILSNSKRGRRQKVKNGKIPGIRRVYGYSFNTEIDILTVNPDERDVYLQMVDWILHGKEGQLMNLSSVARELSLLGIPAPSGDKWYQATVSRILKNPVYTGKFYYGKTEYVQNRGETSVVRKPHQEWQMVPVPAYIDDDTFETLQRKVEALARSNRGARTKGVTYLLKGFVRCGRCGSAVVAGAPSRSKRTGEIMHHYYVCSGKARKVFEVGTGRAVHQCRGRNWRQDVIDSYVWQYLVRCLRQPDEVFEQILERQRDESKLHELRKRKEAAESVLREKRTERTKRLEQNAKGYLPDDDLDQLLPPMMQDIKQLESVLQTANDALESYELDCQRVDEIKATIKSFKRYIHDKITDEEKRKYVQNLVKRAVLHEDEIEIFTTWDIRPNPSTSKPVAGGRQNTADR